MNIGSGRNINILVNDEKLETVENFTYLGSTICSNGDISKEINIRIGKASAAFGRLQRVWQLRNVSLKTKMAVYCSICISMLLYGSGTWQRKLDMANI